MDNDRKLKQDLYIRACKDSGWQLDYIEAAKLVGKIFNCHPFEVYAAFGDMSNMQKVAKGEHPACNREV